jgi:hypothetical protein
MNTSLFNGHNYPASIFQNNETSMEIEIEDNYSDNLKEELGIFHQYVGSFNFNLFNKFYTANLKKISYIQALNKVSQYTNNYNLYIMNFLERHPEEVTNFHKEMFMEFENSMCYYNVELIYQFTNKYPQVVIHNLNPKGQNTLLAFCSTLFCNSANHDKQPQIIEIIKQFILLGLNPLHIDNDGNTILHIISRNIAINHHNLVTKLMQGLINILNNNIEFIINIKNNFGYTALNYIILSGNEHCAALLLVCGSVLTPYDEMILKTNATLKRLVDEFNMQKLINAMSSTTIL